MTNPVFTLETSSAREPAARDAESAARVLARCDLLAQISEDPDCITRTYLSDALALSHKLMSGWMREAGLEARVDAVGNLIGRAGTGNQVFIVGSHLDSVPNAGKYDGILGVMLALEAVSQVVLARPDLPLSLEVIGFGDEEGVRFGTPYLGSRAVAGSFDESLLDLRDQDELSLRQALQSFGRDPQAWPDARYEARRVAGYFEAHIEQGPALEHLQAPLGIVSAIAGQSRLRVRFAGQAGHAGTLPMNHRRDALAAASEWILQVESHAAQTDGLVATVGRLEIEPNTRNVVAGEVVAALDVRHQDDMTRREAVEAMLEAAREVSQRRGLSCEMLSHDEQSAVPMDDLARARLAQAATFEGIEAPTLVSGAGHDAVIMAGIAPVSMLFLRSPGGKSHCPEEAVDAADVALALRVMQRVLHSVLDEAASKLEAEEADGSVAI